MEKIAFQVGKNLDLFRLDIACVRSHPHISRRKIRSIIDVGGCYVNGKRVRIASRQVRRGDNVELLHSEKAIKQSKTKNFLIGDKDILFDRNGIIAVNKPSGIPVQATRLQAKTHLLARLNDHLSKAGKSPRAELAHRLDKETSGVLLTATEKESLELLLSAFRERNIAKTYHCLVYGLPDKNEYEVSLRLRTIDPRTGVVKIAKNNGGRSSLTHFTVLKRFSQNNISLVEARPVTGRSHQIRVHLDYLGFPIVGDKVYGTAKRQRSQESLHNARPE